MELLNTPLPANLPENWTYGQIIAPTGQEVDLPANYGYNYLMVQVNNAQKAALELDRKKAETDMSNITVPSTSLYNLGAKARQNLIQNWYFVGGGTKGTFPINQRGLTSYPQLIQGQYSIDRFMLQNAIYMIGAVTLVPEGIQFLTREGGYGYSSYDQFLDKPLESGLQVTISILLADGRLFTQSGTVSEHDSKPSIQMNLDEHTNISIYRSHIQINTNATHETCLTIAAMKLEYGAAQTLAYQEETGIYTLLDTPDYCTELIKCQSYLLMGTLYGTRAFVNENHLGAWFCLSLPVPMKRSTLSIVGKPKVYNKNGVEVSNFTVTTQCIHNNVVIVGGIGSFGADWDGYIEFPMGTGLSCEPM